MISYLLRGIAIGLLFGLPAGAVGAMTAQRTWSFGARAGLLTGLGSSAADCVYAAVGAFGLTIVSDFLLKYQTVIHFAGGCLILAMGLHLLFSVRRTPKTAGPYANTPSTGTPRSGAGLFLSSFTVGITNPAAILTFLFAFSWFGIEGTSVLSDGICLVAGVLIGTYLWWAALTVFVLWLKKKAGKLTMKSVNRFFGVILCAFGGVILVRDFFG